MRLTIARLRELLVYDPETGIFRNRISRRRVRAGAVAGCINSQGYVIICIDYVHYRAHHIAWLYHYGRWPEGGEMDHEDMVRHHNAIANLREATQSLNNANRRAYSNNKSGYKGVYWHRRNKKWIAMVRKDRKGIHVGSFDCPKAAHEAYLARAEELFGQFARAG